MRWFKRRSDEDFAEEIRSHLEHEADRQLQLGHSLEEAQFAARRRFGNVTGHAEQFHDATRVQWLEALLRNVRYAQRGLLRRPSFAITAILTLAFGIGVNSALFTLLYSLLLRPLPVGDPSSLVNVTREVGENGRPYGIVVMGRASWLSYPDFLHLRDGTRTLEQLAIYRRQPLTLSLGEGSVGLRGELVSCNYFAAVRQPLLLGRPFSADECAHPGDGHVAILSHGLWQRQFGGDASIVGRTVEINRFPLTVIGVASEYFAGIDFDAADIWVPVTLYSSFYPYKANDLERDMSWLAAIGRMRDGYTKEDVRRELTVLAHEEDGVFPGRLSRIDVVSGTRLVDPEDRRLVAPIVAGVTVLGALILLMTCANVMNLLLARAASRRREIAIRLSIGASRRRLIAQLMVESVLLAATGGGLGLLLAYWLPPVIRYVAPDGALNVSLTPDGWVLAATAAIAIGASLVFGLVPALQATDMQLTDAMRGSSSKGGMRLTANGGRWRSAAVGVQVAVSALLLVVAALFLRATQRSTAIAPGFTLNGVSSVTFNLEEMGYDSARTRIFIDEMHDALIASQGITNVGTAQLIPLRGRGTKSVEIVGRANGRSSTLPTLFNTVSGEFFAAAGIDLLRGRAFTRDEARAIDPSAVVVSEAFARDAWGTEEPLGRTIEDERRHFVVVGVARDVQSTALGRLDGPFVYSPAKPNEMAAQHLVVRSTLAKDAVRGAVTRVTRQLDPRVIASVRGFDDELERTIAPVRIAGWLGSALGGVAVLLAAVGVYGVVTFAVSARTREIGIRMALGASQRSVRRLVFGQGARVVGVGLVVGLIGALGAARALQGILFGAPTLDVVVFGSATLVLLAAAGVAVTLPAARASRIDPMTSLRED